MLQVTHLPLKWRGRCCSNQTYVQNRNTSYSLHESQLPSWIAAERTHQTALFNKDVQFITTLCTWKIKFTLIADVLCAWRVLSLVAYFTNHKWDIMCTLFLFQWLKCNGTQGNAVPPTSNLWLKAFPHLRLL